MVEGRLTCVVEIVDVKGLDFIDSCKTLVPSTGA